MGYYGLCNYKNSTSSDNYYSIATIEPFTDYNSQYKEKMVSLQIKLLQDSTIMSDRDTLNFKIPQKVLTEYFNNGIKNLPTLMKISAKISERPHGALLDPILDEI